MQQVLDGALILVYVRCIHDIMYMYVYVCPCSLTLCILLLISPDMEVS
jgi:hypothetical protein